MGSLGPSCHTCSRTSARPSPVPVDSRQDARDSQFPRVTTRDSLPPGAPQSPPWGQGRVRMDVWNGIGNKDLLHWSPKERNQNSLSHQTSSPPLRAKMSSASLKWWEIPFQPSHGSRCPRTSQQNRGVKHGQMVHTLLFLASPRPSKKTKERIDARSRTNMEWWNTNSVYTSPLLEEWTSEPC